MASRFGGGVFRSDCRPRLVRVPELPCCSLVNEYATPLPSAVRLNDGCSRSQSSSIISLHVVILIISTTWLAWVGASPDNPNNAQLIPVARLILTPLTLPSPPPPFATNRCDRPAPPTDRPLANVTRWRTSGDMAGETAAASTPPQAYQSPVAAPSKPGTAGPSTPAPTSTPLPTTPAALPNNASPTPTPAPTTNPATPAAQIASPPSTPGSAQPAAAAPARPPRDEPGPSVPAKRKRALAALEYTEDEIAQVEQRAEA